MIYFSGSNSSSFGPTNSPGHTISGAQMQLLFGEEGVWEAYTSSLSPLRVLKSIPDPLEVLGYSENWLMRTRSPFEYSESEPDSDSDNGIALIASSPTLHKPDLPEDVPLVDWGATETFTRLADNALGLTRVVEARAVATSTPQAESLRAPTNHQDVRGRERPNQKRRAPQRHATPQSHVTANETLVVWRPQDICLRGAVSNASGPKRSQRACTSPRQKARLYGRALKPRRNYGPDDWLSSGEPKKRADDDDALSTCAVFSEEDNKLSRAPLLRPVALPNDNGTSNAASEGLLYSGPDLGGWLTGTFDGVPKLEHLSFPLPVPFPVDQGLLAFTEV